MSLELFWHTMADVYYILHWVFDTLRDFFTILISPLTWVFNFGKGFLVGIGSTPGSIEFQGFTSGVMEILNNIPYFSILTTGIGVGFGILFLSFIFKKIIHI